MTLKSTVLPGLMAAGVLYAAACSNSSPSPMSPSQAVPAAPTLSNAQVMVGGVSVSGLVTRGTGEPTVFQVRVHAPGGLATIQRVSLQYAQPGPNHHGGPMMGGFFGTVYCYDDGTHGDDVPGDGTYHFMDPDDQIGCHAFNAPPGQYQYAFWCEDVYGQRSNTATVTVQRE